MVKEKEKIYIRNKILIFLIITLILLNGCAQSKEGITKYTPSSKLDLVVGKTSNTEKIEVKLISAERVKSYYDPDLKKMKESASGKTYVLVEAELKNIHSENINTGANEFYLVDDKGNRYIPGLYYGENELELFTEIKPNESIGGKLVFVIPESTFAFKIEYDTTSFV